MLNLCGAIRSLQRVVATVILTEYPTPEFFIRIFDLIWSWHAQSTSSSFNLDSCSSAKNFLILIDFRRLVMLINIDIRYNHKFFLPNSSRRNENGNSLKEIQEILYAVISENISNTKRCIAFSLLQVRHQ